jgi:hypothetical protein
MIFYSARAARLAAAPGGQQVQDGALYRQHRAAWVRNEATLKRRDLRRVLRA